MFLKKITSILTAFALSILLIAPAAASATTVDSTSVPIAYVIYNEDGTIVENGTFSGRSPRLAFESKTLYNNQTMLLIPCHEPAGLYCLKGVTMNINYTLDRNARHSFKLYKRTSKTSTSYEMAAYTWENYHLSVPYVTKYSAYYYGEIKNLSSDPITVVTANIEF